MKSKRYFVHFSEKYRTQTPPIKGLHPDSYAVVYAGSEEEAYLSSFRCFNAYFSHITTKEPDASSHPLGVLVEFEAI